MGVTGLYTFSYFVSNMLYKMMRCGDSRRSPAIEQNFRSTAILVNQTVVSLHFLAPDFSTIVGYSGWPWRLPYAVIPLLLWLSYDSGSGFLFPLAT
jgi:hypothetical protein